MNLMAFRCSTSSAGCELGNSPMSAGDRIEECRTLAVQVGDELVGDPHRLNVAVDHQQLVPCGAGGEVAEFGGHPLQGRHLGATPAQLGDDDQEERVGAVEEVPGSRAARALVALSLIHISEPTRRTPISYAVFC